MTNKIQAQRWLSTASALIKDLGGDVSAFPSQFSAGFDGVAKIEGVYSKQITHENALLVEFFIVSGGSEDDPVGERRHWLEILPPQTISPDLPRRRTLYRIQRWAAACFGYAACPAAVKAFLNNEPLGKLLNETISNPRSNVFVSRSVRLRTLDDGDTMHHVWGPCWGDP